MRYLTYIESLKPTDKNDTSIKAMMLYELKELQKRVCDQCDGFGHLAYQCSYRERLYKLAGKSAIMKSTYNTLLLKKRVGRFQ